MASTSETSLTIVVRAWTFMLIFCFAGCAAGSCLSYGHSCWGAHGKRSGHGNGNYLVPPKTMTSDMQQDLTYARDQWILSRLFAGRPLIPLPDKYRTRWNTLSKMKTVLPQNWDADESNVISDESVRDQNNNNNGDDGNRKNIDLQDMMRGMEDDRKDVPEILLISNNEKNEHDSKPQNVELFKFLSNMNENLE